MRVSGGASLTPDQQAAVDALEADTPGESVVEFAAIVNLDLNTYMPRLVEDAAWEEQMGPTVPTVPTDTPAAVETPTWSA